MIAGMIKKSKRQLSERTDAKMIIMQGMIKRSDHKNIQICFHSAAPIARSQCAKPAKKSPIDTGSGSRDIFKYTQYCAIVQIAVTKNTSQLKNESSGVAFWYLRTICSSASLFSDKADACKISLYLAIDVLIDGSDKSSRTSAVMSVMSAGTVLRFFN